MMRKRGFSRFFFHLNRRTHRKYVVVDRELAFVGSQNVSNVHVKKFSGKQAWQDLGIVVKGPGLAFLQNAFDHAWDRSYTPEGRRRWFRRKRAPRLKPFSPVRLNLSPWLRRKFWRDLLYRIRNSKERIWITTPYLAPTRFLLRSLMKASRRGVDVRILLPASSDVFFMRWIATSYYRILVGNGVRVFEYKPRFLHAKSIVLDDWAILGTTNMNVRSFLHDLEVDIVVTGENTKQELASNFESMLKDAKEITNGNITQKFWSGRLGRLFSKVLRYWV